MATSKGRSSAQSAEKIKKKQIKKKQTIIIVTIILLLVASIGLVVSVDSYLEKNRSPLLIYGVWEEQGVPIYAQDTFEVRESGIYMEERLVDTEYVFDGSMLTYQFNNETYKYLVKTEDGAIELQRVSPLHYISYFHLRGRSNTGLNLR